MKHIYLNLKRFDIPPSFGGVNRIAPPAEWGPAVVRGIENGLRAHDPSMADFTVFFPEAHLIGASAARTQDSPVRIGCQSVFREDTAVGGNFGAYTSNRPANAMRALDVETALIGHCEERRDKAGVLSEAGVQDASAVGRLLNRQVKAALAAGMKVLFCIGETAEERPEWRRVLREQLEVGLADIVERCGIVIAYEPVWAIGPGKTPPDRDTIAETAAFIKSIVGGLDLVYGGGLKTDNASMLASISDIDGGLIALTRFQGEIGFYPEEYLDIVRIYLA